MNVDPTGLATTNKPTLYEGVSKLASRVDWPNPKHNWRDEVEDSYFAYIKDVAASAARPVDVAIVMRYFDLQEAASRIFDELMNLETFMTTSDTGNVASHPHLSVFCRLIATSIRVANEIGATPMSRVKLGIYANEGAAAKIALERALQNDPGVGRAVVETSGAITVEVDEEDGEEVIAIKW